MEGFILTSDFYDIRNSHELHFYGRSDEFPFKVIIDNSRPLFFIESSVKISSFSVSFERKSVRLENFNRKKMDALYFQSQKDLIQARDHLHSSGIRTFEADVRPHERFLMERFIKGSVNIKGEGTLVDGVMTYRNPQITPSQKRVDLSVVSLDIETSFGNDLYSIGIHLINGTDEVKRVYMVGPEKKKVNEELFLFPDEKSLLINFSREFLEFDPDVIIGWHVIGFDFKFLEKKYLQYGLEMNLGRGRSRLSINERKGVGWFAKTAGRLIIDGPHALRSAFYKFDNFKLDNVAHILLGTRKDIESTGMEKVKEIERRFQDDKEALAKYNLLDCTLVFDIFSKTGLIDLLMTRSFLSGLQIDRIGVSTAAFDYSFLPKLHREGFVIGNIIDIQRDTQSTGGYVLEPETGLHEHVIVLDFKSLYPSIIRTFKIDPYSMLMGEVDTLYTPDGYKFSKTHHLLPEVISNLFEKRKEAKQRGDKHLSQAIKILMNSFYGVMGSGGSRFYNADLPTAITTTGHWILKKAISYLNSKGYDVVYGDTDSVFVKMKFTEIGRVEKVGDFLAISLNEFFKESIRREFGLESFLEIEYETHFSKLFLPSSRNSEIGAKKRYVGLQVNRVDLNAEDEIKFTGMEFVRSDWTNLSKKFQMNLYRKFFANESIEDYIKEFSKEVKDGLRNDSLVYKKRLTKDIAEYTKSNPPHVKAAKILLEKFPDREIRDIQYVMTRRGPIPVELDHSDVDYQHYLDKQVRPIAEDILRLTEKSFDDLLVGDQLTLF